MPNYLWPDVFSTGHNLYPIWVMGLAFQLSILGRVSLPFVAELTQIHKTPVNYGFGQVKFTYFFKNCSCRLNNNFWLVLAEQEFGTS